MNFRVCYLFYIYVVIIHLCGECKCKNVFLNESNQEVTNGINTLYKYEDNGAAENVNLREKNHVKRAVTARKERLWDYGVIPYKIDNIFGSSHKALFMQAMRHWENFTCIKFVEREPEHHENYILFTIRSCGCCSFVGKRGNGRQAISIGRNCDKFGIVVHELGHVIGFWHEHTRVDRDKHVRINHDNILKGQEYNFNVLPPEDVDSLGLPYDYGSIMHYAKNTFSKSVYLDTIYPIGAGSKQIPDFVIGQRLHLSEGDMKQANILYKCSKCGGTYQQSRGTFSSPSFFLETKNETTNENCEWRITATHTEKIILNITELSLLSTDDCLEDYIEIRDGYWLKSPLIKRLCGNLSSQIIMTNSSRMLITYSNKNIINGYKGFTAKYEVVCGGNVHLNNSIEERIYSPNYPLGYLPEKECVWRITTTNGSQIALKFESFEIENHENCAYDYIEVRDGSSLNSTIIGKFCGYKQPPPLLSSSNEMVIRFISDLSVQKIGFSAILLSEIDECKMGTHDCDQECVNTLGSYECKCSLGYELNTDKKSCKDSCGGILTNPNGTISSPSFPENYPPSEECVWEIIAPTGYNVFLNFTVFDLEGLKYHKKGCNYDFVTLYSKLKDDRLRKIGVFCGNELPTAIKSEENILRIEFSSDKSIQNMGFLAYHISDFDECGVNNGGCEQICTNTYQSYECSCQNGYVLNENLHDCNETKCKFNISAPFGEIYSPNYPQEYPRDVYCFWYLSTTPGHRIHLKFIDFDLEDHQECIYDYLAIYDGLSENSSTLGVYCGEERRPYTILASTNVMLMVLKTDNGLQRKGFTAVHSTECGGYLQATNETQQFYSHPNFGSKNYRNNVYCLWRIQSDPQSSVKIEFQEPFDLEYSQNCTYDYVEIFEDTNVFWYSNYGKFCGNQKPPIIVSFSDTLLIRFESDASTTKEGFTISYVAVRPPDSKELDKYESTPFPGYLKSMFLPDALYDDAGDNGQYDVEYELF